jgi:uncharacterized protein YxeA
MRKHTQGFSIVEILIGVAVIVLIGSVAWLFLSNQKTDTANVQSTNSSEKKSGNIKNTADDTDEIAKNWQTWQPSGKQYSIKFADGWKVYMKQGVEASFYTNGSLALKLGTKAVVSDKRHDDNASLSSQPCAGNTDGGVVLDYLNYSYPEKWYTGKEEKIKTNEGYDVFKTVSPPSDGSQGIPTNYTSYSYMIPGAGEYVMISYTACEDGTDHHDLVEKVVKTFKF